MNKKKIPFGSFLFLMVAVACLTALVSPAATGQTFDYDKLKNMASQYTVIIDLKVEMSFGIHTNEQESKYLGTIVTDDGLVLFNGSALNSDNTLSSFSGFSVKTTPTSITVTTLDGKKYDAEFVGVDRFTNLGFIRLKSTDGQKFKPVRFVKKTDFQIGSWLTLYMLLPDFVTPPLAADIGMVNALLTSPEYFPLTVGFNAYQFSSVLYDEKLEPVGVLGAMTDPSSNSMDPSGMDSFSQMGVPLLGVVTTDKLQKLIAEPPRKGTADRGWLGITLQALTPDMASFWGLDLKSGIIVNDVVKGSPAEKSGMKIGDIIYAVNGEPVDVDKDEKVPIFQRKIADMGPGASVEFSILRRTPDKPDSLQLLANLEKAPMAANDAPEYEDSTLEFSVRGMVFADYLFYNLDSSDFHGVVVSQLKQGGLADLEGLMLGDIIQSIDGTPVASIDDVKGVMAGINEKKPAEIIFFVWRDKKTMFVNVKTDWGKQ
jgi:serine protease Do